jgi:hypothetical protein
VQVNDFHKGAISKEFFAAFRHFFLGTTKRRHGAALTIAAFFGVSSQWGGAPTFVVGLSNPKTANAL